MNAELLARIEDAALNASAPPQQRWLDGWLVRYGPGKAQRARSINAVALGVRPLAAKLAECAALYVAAGLPMIARITPFTQPASLGKVLVERGWQRYDDTQVMLLPGLDVLTPRAVPAGISAQVVDAGVFAAAVGALRGSTPTQIEGHARRVALSPVPYTGMLWHRDGELVACGQFARDGGLVGLYDVFTAPQARGQGLAVALCAQLLADSASAGARLAYLQVEAENHAALAAYRRLGFTKAYCYYYLHAEASAY